MTRKGFFGGSFNPPHIGHLLLAEMARSEKDLDEVLFIPAGNPPHKRVRRLAPAGQRCRMVELAVQDNDAFSVSRIELEREGPSYTLRTARKLQERMQPEDELFLMLGADSVRDLPEWWHGEQLVEETNLIVLKRPGYPLSSLDELKQTFGPATVDKIQRSVVEAPQLQISSSMIRTRLKRGLSVRYLVPAGVRNYIQANDIY